jgi:hypothetical protein
VPVRSCLADLVHNAIFQLDVDQRAALLQNIVVIGGGSFIPGLTDRLNFELAQRSSWKMALCTKSAKPTRRFRLRDVSESGTLLRDDGHRRRQLHPWSYRSIELRTGTEDSRQQDQDSQSWKCHREKVSTQALTLTQNVRTVLFPLILAHP